MDLPLSIGFEEEREAAGERAEVAMEDVEQEDDDEGLFILGR